MNLLEKNWNKIVHKVINPLWKNEFNSMYINSKLDYDDFLSLAGYELSKAISSFDSDKSNFYTFCTNIIKRKAKTELRDYNERDKRKTLNVASSLDIPEALNIPDKISCETNELSQYRIKEFVNNISNLQLRILILKLLGFPETEIREIIDTKKERFNDAIKALKSEETLRVLYRRNFNI